MIATKENENVNQHEKAISKPDFRYLLMIDDDPLTNFLNRKMLLHYGALATIKTFVSAHNALQFVDELNKSSDSVDEVCVLLDLQMVEMDGIDFLENLKKRSLNIKIRIYLVSGSLPLEHIEKLKDFSLAGFFLKPISKGNVKEVLMPLNPVYFNGLETK